VRIDPLATPRQGPPIPLSTDPDISETRLSSPIAPNTETNCKSNGPGLGSRREKRMESGMQPRGWITEGVPSLRPPTVGTVLLFKARPPSTSGRVARADGCANSSCQCQCERETSNVGLRRRGEWLPRSGLRQSGASRRGAAPHPLRSLPIASFNSRNLAERTCVRARLLHLPPPPPRPSFALDSLAHSISMSRLRDVDVRSHGGARGRTFGRTFGRSSPELQDAASTGL
jgi:hypothetical protein